MNQKTVYLVITKILGALLLGALIIYLYSSPSEPPNSTPTVTDSPGGDTSTELNTSTDAITDGPTEPTESEPPGPPDGFDTTTGIATTDVTDSDDDTTTPEEEDPEKVTNTNL